MTLLRFSLLSALIGAALSILFYVTHSWIPPPLDVYRDKIMLMLCPTSIFLLLPQPPTVPQLSTLAFITSAIANSLLYAILGAFFWLGVHKHLLFSLIASGAILGIWWRVLTL